jgi:predicted small lipoprotein YifL
MGRLIRILTVAGFAVLVTACGARGPLEPPPGSTHDPNADPPFILDPVIGKSE